MENWDLVPAWFVGLNLMYTGFIWLVTRGVKIRMDSKIWGNTFVWIGLLYMFSYLNVNPEPHLVERIVWSRVMICIMCLSQWFPLTVSYLRNLRNKKVMDGFVRDFDNIDRDS